VTAAAPGAFGVDVGGGLRDRLQAALGARYAVGAEVGAGGMARVFAATRAADGQGVAVKVLAPAVAACCDADRFRREMAVVRALRHPRIVPLVDECESCGGERMFYFVMPYVDGETLRARLDREGPLPVAEAVRLLWQVADAVAYAHARGVVHRDIKPANVLLADGGALVADFGIAKALSVSAAPSGAARIGPADQPDQRGGGCEATCARAIPAAVADGLTGAGSIVGTPAYMAPEQAVGDPDADHRVDLYALGVVAYEMLAGVPPVRRPAGARALDRPPARGAAAARGAAPRRAAGARRARHAPTREGPPPTARTARTTCLRALDALERVRRDGPPVDARAAGGARMRERPPGEGGRSRTRSGSARRSGVAAAVAAAGAGAARTAAGAARAVAAAGVGRSVLQGRAGAREDLPWRRWRPRVGESRAHFRSDAQQLSRTSRGTVRGGGRRRTAAQGAWADRQERNERGLGRAPPARPRAGTGEGTAETEPNRNR
jgi:serine/threonine-protein kinase